jgi:hypothetical protein
MVCRVPFEGESMLDLRNAIVACQYKPVRFIFSITDHGDLQNKQLTPVSELPD